MRKKEKKRAAVKQMALWLIAFVAYFTACDTQDLQIETKNVPVQFVAYNIDEVQSRVTGSQWDDKDEIGLFAIKANSDLESENIIDNNDNRQYITTGNGRFIPKNNQNIFYPQDGSAIDIVGYYPYSDLVNNYVYPIDLENQTEVLYSNNLKGISLTNNSDNGLHFKRALSKLVINISPKVEGESLEGITTTIIGANTKGSLFLVDGKLDINKESKKDLIVESVGSSTNKQVTAFLFPTESENEIKVKFTFPNGKSYTWVVPNAFAVGKQYTHNIKLDGLGSVEVVESSYMEIPIYKGGVEAPNSIQVMHMVEDISWLNKSYTNNGTDATRNYTVLYDKQYRIPLWVAHPMHPVYFGSSGRTDAWGYDPRIPQKDQPNLSKSWVGANDRGHVLASSDRTSSKPINRTTFYYTNMVPQNGPMNQGPWNNLENQVRTWANNISTYDTLFVVTGSVLPKIPQQITYDSDRDGKKSAIPEYMYKALLKKHKKTGEYTSIVIKMMNNSTAARTTMSVAELEEETGFTFFNALPPSQAAKVKQNKNTSPHWN